MPMSARSAKVRISAAKGGDILARDPGRLRLADDGRDARRRRPRLARRLAPPRGRAVRRGPRARGDGPGRRLGAWRAEREALYRGHPQSPVPAAERDAFRAHHWPYDDRLRDDGRRGARRPPAPTGLALAPLALPNSGAESPAFDRIGTVPPAPAGRRAWTSPLFWMRGYAGGLFLPLGDATNGAETYGAGRYLLDAAKSADLGGDAAGRHARRRPRTSRSSRRAPSTRSGRARSPRRESRVAVRIEAGERLPLNRRCPTGATMGPCPPLPRST